MFALVTQHVLAVYMNFIMIMLPALNVSILIILISKESVLPLVIQIHINYLLLQFTELLELKAVCITVQVDIQYFIRGTVRSIVLQHVQLQHSNCLKIDALSQFVIKINILIIWLLLNRQLIWLNFAWLVTKIVKIVMVEPAQIALHALFPLSCKMVFNFIKLKIIIYFV